MKQREMGKIAETETTTAPAGCGGAADGLDKPPS